MLMLHMSGMGKNEDQSPDIEIRPRLRAVEAQPHPGADRSMVVVHDPAGLTDVTLSMSLPALHILGLLDGQHTLEDIESAFAQEFRQSVACETIEKLLHNLQEAHFLEGPAFEQYYNRRIQEYHLAPTRKMNDLRGLGLGEGDISQRLNSMFPWKANGRTDGEVVGIVAPHLDYPRGRPCYLEAYSALVSQKHIKRFVILGTNHFGRSCSVVATSKAFETPLGISEVDVAFLDGLEQQCGDSLKPYEFDHRREHSVELQVLLLQHLFGCEGFEIVPLLCPNPCGASGTAPENGEGVDLKVFALALGRSLEEDDKPTCVIAGADLSHVGRFFGDAAPLTEDFLKQVEARDRSALQCVIDNEAHGLLDTLTQDDNSTRICSAGCIYALRVALPHARAQLLHHHQAVDEDAQCCVSCSAMVFSSP